MTLNIPIISSVVNDITSNLTSFIDISHHVTINIQQIFGTTGFHQRATFLKSINFAKTKTM